MKDNRVANLLSMVGLENRSWDSSLNESINVSLDIDFDKAIHIIDSERIRCYNWLKSELA